MSFYRQHRRGIWIAAFALAAVYLVGHELVLDTDLEYRGLWEFLKEGRGHVLHVSPVLIAFLILLAKDRLSRR